MQLNMKRRSITRRLIVSVVVTQLILTAGVVALSTYLTKWQLRSAFDSALHGRAMSVAALVRFSEDEHPHLIFDSAQAPPSLDHEQQDMYEIFGSDGKVIGRSPQWADPVATSQPAGRPYWNAQVGHERYRVIRLDTPVLDSEGPEVTASATITVLYAASTDEIRERVWEVAILASMGSLVLLGLATAITVWAVRKGLGPLAALATSAGEVTARDWKLHAPEEALATIELAPLTAAMDRMLATLERAFTSQREFVTNAAHELKTPIAVLKSTLQLALQKPRTADQYRNDLQNALEDAARLESLTHSMLRLARAEQLRPGQRLDLPTLDLAASCETSAERWRPLAEAKSVRVQLETGGTPQIKGDPDDLEIIWNNLLDNAIRYSPPGGEVRLTISRDNGQARIEVRDQGPGIRQQDLQNIFGRFHRSDASRSRETGGYGLGLAIAKAMVEAYGGTIGAETLPSRGTAFCVKLPILP
ncbi:MAG TPA: ATP-binding protein [Terriglobales bacterium]|nr:ATP-binding protein [Terriglobales bacterium]